MKAAESRRMWMKTILTIVVLIIAYAITRLVIWNAPPAASSIAVLPFESLSPDKENAFFADGVYDGVSTKLAKLASLKVISHNSVAKYRGARNTKEIGRTLNVAYVLEGSVRRETGRIHLNAQLIDTRTDAPVWAQEYDRDLSDVFALQSEIAQKIADQLGQIHFASPTP
jgi:TolB-like protein